MFIEADDGTVINSNPARIPPQPKTYIAAYAIALGVLSGVPYSTPAYKAAGGNFVLGSLFVICTNLAYGTVATWGWNHLLTDFTNKYNAGEFSNARNVAHAGGACFMALFSSAMNYSISSRYNTSKLFPMMAFVNWYGLDTTGYYKIIGYVTGIAPLQTRNQNHSFLEDTLKKIIMICPVGNLIVNSYLSFKSAREKIVDTDLEALPFSLLALSIFALDVFSAWETLEEAFAARDDADYERQYSAMTQLVFKVIALTIITCATSSDGFIASDTFHHTIAGNVLALLAVGSGVILGNYLLNDLTKGMFFKKKPVAAQLANGESMPLLATATPASSDIVSTPSHHGLR